MSDRRSQRRKTHITTERPPFERIALILQGGGALGAYQAGVYQALAEANRHSGSQVARSQGRSLPQSPQSGTLARRPPGRCAEFFRATGAATISSTKGTLDATSYYDVAPLRATLERLVDFDLINARDAFQCGYGQCSYR